MARLSLLSLKLSRGQPIFINPRLVTSVCAATPPSDEDGAVPADYTPPKTYVFVVGDNEGIGVQESVGDVANMLEDALNA